MKQGITHRIFLHSLRTALIFVAGILIYELLLKLENDWNKNNPGHKKYNFHKRNILKFILIFMVDFVILYVFYWVFNTNL